MPPIEMVKQIEREGGKKGEEVCFSFITQKCCLAERRTRISKESKPEKPKLWLNSLRRGAVWCEAKQAVHCVPART